MPLPNPGQDAVPFTTLTAQFYDETIENIESLSNGTGFEDNSIGKDAMLNTEWSYGMLSFNTYGLAGGQIIGASTTTIGFNTLTTNSRTGITNPATGQMQASEEATYTVSLNTNITDSPMSGNLQYIEKSTDGGATWSPITSTQPGVTMTTGRGLSTSTTTYLTANARVRGRYFSAGGNTRVAADSAATTEICSLKMSLSA